MKQDRDLPRHPSDGGGRAWFVAGSKQAGAAVGTPGRWDLVYEAGPEGVADGGMIYLQGSPFWGWSVPQVVQSRAPGYVEVSAPANGVQLTPTPLGRDLVGIKVGGGSRIASF